VQDNAGPAAARNAGAARARFDYLAFTDDDCVPHAQWLSGLASAFEDTPDAVLGGQVVNGLADTPCSEASHQLVEYVVDYFLEAGAPFFPSNNLALARSHFDAVGGFDQSFPLAAGEDRDFCAKCREAGLSLTLANEAVVEHRHALHLRSFLRQHFNYGRGAFVCRQLEAARTAPDFHIEPLRFYFDLVATPFRRDRVFAGRLQIAALLVLSQVANAAGFFKERFGASK
jgi:GT2 family glycosyltransferase